MICYPVFLAVVVLIEKSEMIKSKSGYCFLINDLDSETAVEREKKRESKFSQP